MRNGSIKEETDRILEQIEVDISEIDLYGYDIIETSLSMVHKLQSILNDLRMRVQTYVFPGQAEMAVHMLNWAIRSVKFLGVEFDQSEDEEVSVSDTTHL